MANDVDIKLTKWEVQNVILPPVTTITIYEGHPSLEALQKRVQMMIGKNPWITSRVVKRKGSPIALSYDPDVKTETVVSHYIHMDDSPAATLSLNLPYGDLVSHMTPFQCARTKFATNTDEVLFKVTIIPVKKGSSTLSERMNSDGHALVVSMNHTLGDGHTYYQLYRMLCDGAQIEAFNPVRKDGFEEAKTEVIGAPEQRMFTSAGYGLNIMGKFLVGKISKKPPQNLLINEVDPAWISDQKAVAKAEGSVPFISSNDAVTSWYFSTMKADMNLLVANFRSRTPSILGLTDSDIGNYEANVPYFPQDVATPSLIRQSISDGNNGFQAKRAAKPVTEIPGFRKLLKCDTSIITNWATFYSDLVVQNIEGAALQPKLHLPIMEPDGLITSIWNSCVVFRPSAGKLAMLLITCNLEADAVERSKTAGERTPLGIRIL